MKIKNILVFALVIAALTVILSGCGSSELDLEGKNIVTFELEGGILNYGTSMVDTYIKYAYEPNTYILDPTTDFSGYELTRNGYNFTGWYTSKECNPQDKWDFDSRTFDTETLTLYAGWEKAIVYSFTVYYVDGESDVALGKYSVKSGDKFEDWRKYASDRKGYTPMGYYSDRELTTAWSFDTVHPGGDVDLDIPVYVDYIEGEWSLVETLEQLKRAVNDGKNVYLLNDIDCEGEEIYFSKSYNGTFEGNGHSISDFNVPKSGGVVIPACSIFSSLGEKAKIQNVSFLDVTYVMTGISEAATKVKYAALAVSSDNATLENVTIEGEIYTNVGDKIEDLNDLFYEESGSEKLTGVTVNVTVAPLEESPDVTVD